jgi:hypothetical protein
MILAQQNHCLVRALNLTPVPQGNDGQVAIKIFDDHLIREKHWNIGSRVGLWQRGKCGAIAIAMGSEYTLPTDTVR